MGFEKCSNVRAELGESASRNRFADYVGAIEHADTRQWHSTAFGQGNRVAVANLFHFNDGLGGEPAAYRVSQSLVGCAHHTDGATFFADGKLQGFAIPLHNGGLNRALGRSALQDLEHRVSQARIEKLDLDETAERRRQRRRTPTSRPRWSSCGRRVQIRPEKDAGDCT